jgi:hypothetical protein
MLSLPSEVSDGYFTRLASRRGLSTRAMARASVNSASDIGSFSYGAPISVAMHRAGERACISADLDPVVELARATHALHLPSNGLADDIDDTSTQIVQVPTRHAAVGGAYQCRWHLRHLDGGESKE